MNNMMLTGQLKEDRQALC